MSTESHHIYAVSPGRVAMVASDRPPRELLLLLSEIVAMQEARWGSLIKPDGSVYRNFTRVSRPGFGPRFASGKDSAPKPAATGLEVSREMDGWSLEIVFDETKLTYSELAARLEAVLRFVRE